MRRYFSALVCIIVVSAVRCDPDVFAHRAAYVTAAPVELVDPATGEHSVSLSVLIYNVADLPWPLASDRDEALRRIGDELFALRRAGNAPDIVLLQEAFTDRSDEMAARAGYVFAARGPARGEAPRNPGEADDFRAGRKFWKGEKLGKVVGSGLVALSSYPITEIVRRPFRRHDCAGFDCLAAKGILLVRVQVPGVPAPVDIMTTHVNSRRSSGVPDTRSLRAHHLQFDEIASFVADHRDPDNPFVLGGDLNARHAPARYTYAAARIRHPFVHDYCRGAGGGCQVAMKLEGDTPGINTQDLQAFDSGAAVSIRPTRMMLMFDQQVGGTMLSDHMALLVVYQLSWKPEVVTASAQ